MLTKIINYVKSLSIFKIFILIFIAGLFYGGISLYLKYTGFAQFMSKTRVIAVKAVSVKIDTVQKTYRALSIIEARQSINVTSKVNGLLDNIHYSEATTVKKGDLLFSIISSDTIGLTKIHAPFTGIIGLSKKNIGDVVSKGELLTSLDEYSYMKLPIDLPERILGYLTKKLSFIATIDGIPGVKYKGTLEYVDTRIDINTRTISAYALLENKNNILKPGLLMKMDIFLEEKEGAILIPEKSLLSINKKHYVYIVDNDIAKLTMVQIGIRNNTLIEIKSGLKTVDKVIFMGHEKLKDGSKVKVIE
jgi:multidrug efflux pump subunit AcrA (membrane-fusion protein)|tara:strand:+ start:1052 stop:1966 length:915 start_codon:yes stop_codon:yes gene_type:complete